MQPLVRRINLQQANDETVRTMLRRQWLLTNGLGGYASGTVSGSISWRYHGLLIAALPAPYGRMVLLNHLSEAVQLPNGSWQPIGVVEMAREENAAPSSFVTEFRLENLLPVWRYDIAGIILEKQIVLLHAQNTVHVNYCLLSNQESVQLQLRPFVHFRRHEQPLTHDLGNDYFISIRGERYEISATEEPTLKLQFEAEETLFTGDGGSQREIYYEKEAERGYEARGILWSPGHFRFKLAPKKKAAVIASAESWSKMLALSPEEALQIHDSRCERLISLADVRAREGPVAELVLAADQFIIEPVGRVADAARANAAGDEVRTVIAGYHWFTDWGRDTMISLEGLTLTTGRHAEAGWILRMFAQHIRDGLIPNLFPEAENKGLYHTADATLWFFHALDRYLEYTNDRQTLRRLLPKLIDVIEHHLRGTRFGIGVDPADGLLIQGQKDYQLTWMDAKVDGWVVTPRRGKAVEINALWYNALRLAENWVRTEQGDDAAASLAEQAQRAHDSFNRRFWFAQGNYLYDVVDGEDGDDSACRPNQIIAIALKHPVLEPAYWKPVIETVQRKLVTPFGLRSLSPDHRDFKPKYFGDLRDRDAAYHQGTVWAWLVGPYIDAWLKTFPDDREGASRCLDGFVSHLNQACVGSISEIFDAEPPFTPRGCIAQAWSVAEVLRSWVRAGEPPGVGPAKS